MRAYSMDLRERVFADCQAGMTTPAVAAKYRVSAARVRRLKQRHRATGSLAPRPHSPGRPVTPDLIRGPPSSEGRSHQQPGRETGTRQAEASAHQRHPAPEV